MKSLITKKIRNLTAITIHVMLASMLTIPVNAEANESSPTYDLNLDRLPEFNLEVLDHNFSITNDAMKGNYYLIYFWGTSCKSCIEEMPYLHDTYEEFRDENFEILSVAADQNIESIEEYRKVYPMPWLHTIIGKDDYTMAEVTSKFRIQKWPQKFLVSPEGELLESFKGFTGEKLKEQVSEHLE